MQPELSPWTLHLDDEGYPIMEGGIRGDEEEFLKVVFANLRRFQSSDMQPLFTEMDGKQIIVTAFDDPLIATEVSRVGESLRWRFLGNLEHTTRVNDLRVDEWNRLHAYVGAENIPAVMSRKAQAAFLLNYKDLASLQPQPFRGGTAPTSRWSEAYKKNEATWNMGTPNPVFVAHSSRALAESGPLWLVPGAGHGHEIPVMEKAGKTVTAVDISIEAKEHFRSLYPTSKAEYLVEDFFQQSIRNADAIFDYNFFVALNPKLRAPLIQRIYKLLNKGGLYCGVFFTRIAEGGPPFGLSEWELKAHIDPYFEILEWHRSPHSHPKRAHMELWAMLRKK
jgi:SAM-dependent methyltransferase